MGDVNLEPIFKMVEIKNKSKKEYNKLLEDIEEVTDDLNKMAVRVTEKQRKILYDQEQEWKAKAAEKIKEEGKNKSVN